MYFICVLYVRVFVFCLIFAIILDNWVPVQNLNLCRVIKINLNIRKITSNSFARINPKLMPLKLIPEQSLGVVLGGILKNIKSEEKKKNIWEQSFNAVKTHPGVVLGSSPWRLKNIKSEEKKKNIWEQSFNAVKTHPGVVLYSKNRRTNYSGLLLWCTPDDFTK